MFRLTQKSINQTVAKFNILNQSGEVVGSVNVPPNQVEDLLRCWQGERPQAQATKQKENPMVAAMLRLKPRAMSRQAVLRGCL